MGEFLGLAYFAEVPVVLVNVQRAGPSTGMPTRTQQPDVMACAYASHGDTKHVLLFPSTPKECFDQTAQAFDLAERLQTPVIVMSDLDLGMNDHLSEPFEWDDNRSYDRGKVHDAEALEEIERDGGRYGRYLDVDGDGIGYRTYPGTHPTKGSFFTRGTSRDPYAVYTEDGAVYAENMDRLIRKFNTAKDYIPKPETFVSEASKGKSSKLGMIFYGTSQQAAAEALDYLAAEGVHLKGLSLKAFPFNQDVEDFIADCDQIFVIDQNRDGQMRTLLINELELNPAGLIPLLNYDGMPITADYICQQVRKQLDVMAEGLREAN